MVQQKNQQYFIIKGIIITIVIITKKTWTRKFNNKQPIDNFLKNFGASAITIRK